MLCMASYCSSLKARGQAHPDAVSNECLQVQFSPDGRWIATASFDKGVKLWDGFKGSFVATFRQVATVINHPHPHPPCMPMLPVLQLPCCSIISTACWTLSCCPLAKRCTGVIECALEAELLDLASCHRYITYARHGWISVKGVTLDQCHACGNHVQAV